MINVLFHQNQPRVDKKSFSDVGESKGDVHIHYVVKLRSTVINYHAQTVIHIGPPLEVINKNNVTAYSYNSDQTKPFSYSLT